VKVFLILLLAGLVLACSRSIELGSDAVQLVASAGSPADAGIGSTSCVVTKCDGKIYACGDCVDNDGDGLIDAADPECLGACDNTEDSYYSGIPGKSDANCKLDCYFDGDNGSGNDDCHWSTACDPLSLAPNYPPSSDAQCAYDPLTTIPGTASTCEQLYDAQSANCIAICLPMTPKSCDCFGCCEIPLSSGRYVWLGSTANGVGSCNHTVLEDPSQCHPCTQIPSCRN
jgi:hypothetical protein